MRAKTILLGLVLLAACSRQTSGTLSREAELKAANAAYDEALLNGDAAALARVYTDDFQIIDDDANVSGKRDQIRFMTEQVDLLNARSDDVQTTMLGPDAALVTGRFTGRYRYQGKENDFVERYTSVWVNQGGEWKMRHEHSSIVPQPTTPSG